MDIMSLPSSWYEPSFLYPEALNVGEVYYKATKSKRTNLGTSGKRHPGQEQLWASIAKHQQFSNIF